MSASERRGGRRLPPWGRVGLTLLAACVVVGGILFWLRRPTPPKPIPDPLTVLFSSATMACPQSAAWSPDGTQVAVLGYVACGGPDDNSANSNGAVLSLPNTGGTLLLYDANSGHLSATIALDSATEVVVPESVRADPSAMRFVSLGYDTLMWAPDGKQLAIRFGASRTTLHDDNFVTTNYGQGLLLVTAASGALKLLPQKDAPKIDYSTTSFAPVTVVRWDLGAGTGALGTLPQALAYRWNSDGTLVPSMPLPTSASAPAPAAPHGAVGNPDGGKEFTAWQNGFLNYTEQCTTPPDPNTPPLCCPITSYLSGGVYTMTGAWSPDGRYLILPYGIGIGAFGKIATPPGTPTPTQPAGCPLPGSNGSDTLVNMPVRDAAVAGILKGLIPPVPYDGHGPFLQAAGPSSAQFAWSPDGQRVLVTEQYNGPVIENAPVFSLYDTATGKQTASLTSPQIIALSHLPSNVLFKGQSVSFSATLWSPNSQRLILLDPFNHYMLLLGAKSLKG